METRIRNTEVQRRVAAGAAIVDVMTPEDYAACHLAGAHNACIYEVVFLARMAEAVPQRGTEIIVYDATGTTRAAELARERLLEAGYTRVLILDGGLLAWCNQGLPVERQEAPPTAVLTDGRYQLDIAASRVEWIGRNIGNRHIGQVTPRAGFFQITDGVPTAAEVVVAMPSLTNADLQDPEYRNLLINHLKSEDFFAVERFSTATLVLVDWDPESHACTETIGGTITADLTIKGQTLPIRFPALLAPAPDGRLRMHATFDFDRTLWGVLYGSGKYFERLGMHLVHDTVSIELFIVAQKTA